jgi:hypothetical protein
MSTYWLQGLAALALLSTGVVYGTDVFFTLVARPALRRADAASLTRVLGHLHAVGDTRMPLIGGTGLLATAGLTLAAGGWHTRPGSLALLALVGLLTHLMVYLRVAKPVNQAQSAAAQHDIIPPDARALQTRWDSVIGLRAGVLTVAMGALLAAALGLSSMG